MTPAASTISLRRSLLRRLTAPLSILVLTSGPFAYLLAWHYTEHVSDRSLSHLAAAIAKQIELSGPQARITVPPLARAMFSDPDEQFIYRVIDGGNELAGDAQLPLTGTRMRRVERAHAFYVNYRGSHLRLVQLQVQQVGRPPIIVEIGHRVERRCRLSAEFALAIMIPLVISLLAGWLIVWSVVNQQLNPLTQLADSLNRQTHTSLEPLDETRVPVEIRPLTSALNALLERLKAAIDVQRKFISDAAHQLRTPLTALKLHAEQAARARDPEQTLTAVHELRESANRAVRLSNQLLSLARAEPNMQTARFAPVDLAALAFETGAEWVPRALAARIDLGFQRQHKGDEALYVRGNAVLLREVLANLIDNALKYVPPHRNGDGRITVTVERVAAVPGQPLASLTVEDTGPGVPEQARVDLFKRFFRGDARATADGGAGLGLAIVHDIVALHGGTVHYESPSNGGSRFVVRIPLTEPEPAFRGTQGDAPARQTINS